MRQNLIYSFVVFLLLFTYMCAGFLTQLVMGVEKWEDTPFILGTVLAVSAIVSVPFFFVIKAVRKRFAGTPEDPNYRPSTSFVAIASVLVAFSLFVGVFKSYSGANEKKQAAEAEKQRLAAMTPEQLAAEAKRKDEQAKAAARAAADEATRKESEIREQVAKEALRHDVGIAEAACQLAAEKSANDPSSIEWIRSERVFRFTSADGTKALSIQPMRAKNGFGALVRGGVQCELVKRGDTWDVKHFKELR